MWLRRWSHSTALCQLSVTVPLVLRDSSSALYCCHSDGSSSNFLPFCSLQLVFYFLNFTDLCLFVALVERVGRFVQSRSLWYCRNFVHFHLARHPTLPQSSTANFCCRSSFFIRKAKSKLFCRALRLCIALRLSLSLATTILWSDSKSNFESARQLCNELIHLPQRSIWSSWLLFPLTFNSTVT